MLTMLSGLRTFITLGETQVNNMHEILFLADSNQEVFWLYISMNKIFRMHRLNPCNHLLSEIDNGLNLEFLLAKIEQVLEAWTKDVHDKDIIVSFNAEPLDVRESRHSL